MPELPGAHRGRTDRYGSSGHPAQLCVKLQDTGAPAGADVDPGPGRHLRRGLGRRHECRDRVLHHHVVARLGAVTEHGDRLASQKPRTEDRDHPRLPGRILPWSVHVAQPETDRVQPGQFVQGHQIVLGGAFADSIGTRRLSGRILTDGQSGRFAVHCPARPGEHQPSASRGHGRLCHCEGPEHVHPCVAQRVADASADVSTSGQVKHDLRTERGDQAVQPWRGHVPFGQTHQATHPGPRQVRPGPTGQVIHHEDLMMCPDQAIHQV